MPFIAWVCLVFLAVILALAFIMEYLTRPLYETVDYNNMTFQELQDCIDDVLEARYLESVKFGCDCGCGGDLYTAEEFDNIFLHAEKAKEALAKLGIEDV